MKEDDLGTNLKTGSYKESELAKIFYETLTLLETAVSDFKYYAPSNGPATFTAAPVLKEGNAIGAVVFQIENEEVYKLMQDYTGLGKTGETLIGSKIGNDIVFLNPLRHDPQAAFRRTVPIGTKEALPIQEAVQGRKGSGLSIDYRGKEILAAWRYLPFPRWGMVVKIDTKEAFSPISNIRNWSLIVGITIVLAVVFLALFISKSISDPIAKLYEGTEKIGSGNLDYRVGTGAKDEIGQLSRAFDKMTESLKGTTVSRDVLSKEIIEHRKSEETLRRSEEKFRTLVTNIPDVTWTSDSEGNTTFISSNIKEIYGYNPEEIYKRGAELWFERIHPDDVENVRGAFGALFETADFRYDIEYRIKSKDGEWIWLHDRAIAIYKEGGMSYADGVLTDITERKHIEHDMHQLRAELLHTTRAMTMVELTAALAHELNHPLGSILNNANAAKRFLANKNPDLDEIREIIGDIISEDRRASDVMQKLRALMKKAEFELASLNINNVIEDVLLLTHSELVINNISVTKQLQKKLPQINGDRIQLQQVFINLVINATDVMKESKAKNITISTAKHGAESVIICVSDTGVGCDEKDKDNLFEPFFTTKRKGMGMGLSVSKTIVKFHGGDIWFENSKEGGASFFVTLPKYKEKSS
jgi:PAS domain S-box-containing protein